MLKMKKAIPKKAAPQEAQIKDFFDLVSPGAVKFNVDHYILGDSYRCAWAIREYPPTTPEQAILARFGEREGVTLRIYSRMVDAAEQRKVIQNATRKNRMLSTSNDVQETINAEGNMEDVVELLANMRREREPLLHCAVFMELQAQSLDKLKELQAEIGMELTREKLSVDRLTLRQKEGFLSVHPAGYNAFGAEYERVLPASSTANLYPFSYSGKTDPHGFYIGRDRFGTNILVDFDRRADDVTNGSGLILGNSGQGKSYLVKLLLTNFRESGKAVLGLDVEGEYEDLCGNLGGCYLDFMSGQYRINLLEPKAWAVGQPEPESAAGDDGFVPEAFRKATRLSQHIAFLKDFFRSYKDFDDGHIDAIEIMVSRLYAKFGINDSTDFDQLQPTDYPIMSDLYDLIEAEYKGYEQGQKSLFTEDLLRDICLGLYSMCKGAEARFFDGHTNISDANFLFFGLKGLMETNRKLKDAVLFNLLSYMNHKLLVNGDTVAAIDELYMYLSNLTAIEYIRNAMKRVRKKDSNILLASQNIEDFLIDGIREYTKPLFSIPSHHFLFNAGNIDPQLYMDALQLEPNEFDLIRYPERGVCLYRCGNERYLLQVVAPDYKSALFGKAGGR